MSEQQQQVTKKSPTDFLNLILGQRVFVRLNSGIDYKGVLACLDGYMNIALEQTEEYVDGELRNRYGDAFIRGNNVLYISTAQMDSESVQNFCAVTGAEPDVALGYLQVSENNVEQAISLYFENGGQALQSHGATAPTAASDTGMSAGAGLEPDFNDAARAPIASRREVLVDGYGGRGFGNMATYGGYMRDTSHSAARSIFNQGSAAAGRVPFRDFAQEAADIAGGDSASARRNRLAELFKPPFDIMHRGDLASARLAARESGKWLLLNIQEVSDFRCQALNRDIWRQQIIKDAVSKDFVFFQISTDTTEGTRLVTMYSATEFPFVAALDPRTGEMKRIFLQLTNVSDMLEDMANFVLDSPPPLASSSSAVAHSSGAIASTRAYGGLHNMTEEEQLAAAIAASELDGSNTRQSSRSGGTARNAINVGSDSEDSYGDGSDDGSFSEIRTISSDSEGYDYHDVDDDDDDYDEMDIDAVSDANERLAAQRAAAAAVTADTVQGDVHAPVSDVPKSWYSLLPNEAPAEPDLGPAVTRIQLRFPDGRRVVRRFAKSDRVSTIFQYLKATLPEAANDIPEVMFMGNRIEDSRDQTIEEAKLVNASIVIDI
ncbi:UBX domain protein Ubx2 [Coemansia erecta]|uniref:UBX domain protein Ubx2 n=1 Tax=Coemansia erecta TaxID=147472 RepID=A0A9W7XXF4_9FUNG|nr:UBX domain protein Ubx2 [Coemansia erecta]